MNIKTICGVSVAALAIFGGAVPAAHADTYCVSRPGCVGDWYGDDLDKALSLAEASTGEADAIRLGPGHFSSPDGFRYDAGGNALNDLTIEGVQGETSLGTGSSATSGVTLLDIKATGADQNYVHGLNLAVPADNDGPIDTIGLRLEQAAAEDSEIHVINYPANGVFSGVELWSGAKLRRTLVSLQPSQPGAAVRLMSSGTLTEDVQVFGAKVGFVVSAPGKAAIRRARIDALAGSHQGILCSSCGDLDVDNSVIRLWQDAAGVEAHAAAGKTADVDASHLTIVGWPPNNATAVKARSLGAASAAAIKLDNSVLHTVYKTLAAQGDSSGTGGALIVSRHNMFAAGKESTSNNGQIDAQETLAPDPGFVDQGAGDLRPLHSSGLIDAGRWPTVFVTSGFDAGPYNRLVDGDADGTKAPDLGAYEYRALKPVVKVVGPTTAVAGQTVTLDGSNSHGGDPGEKVALFWKFESGGSATTPTVDVSFDQPGIHKVVLTATDPTGKESSWFHEIVVTPPAGPAPEPTPTPAAEPSPSPAPSPDPVPTPLPMPTTPPDTRLGTTPLLTGVQASVVRRRLRVRATIAEPATVAVRIERRSGGRWRRVQSVTGAHPAGARRITLRPLRRRGAYRAVVTARTALRRESRPVRFRVR